MSTEPSSQNKCWMFLTILFIYQGPIYYFNRAFVGTIIDQFHLIV